MRYPVNKTGIIYSGLRLCIPLLAIYKVIDLAYDLATFVDPSAHYKFSTFMFESSELLADIYQNYLKKRLCGSTYADLKTVNH